jgi:hypothetical protein
MTASPKKPGAAFWITVALVVMLVGYPLSFGPACWISSRVECGETAVSRIYQPVMRLSFWGDYPGKTLTGDLLHDYARSLASTRKSWRITLDTTRRAYAWEAR